MEDFYTRVLGFTVTDRGKVRCADIVFTSWDPKDHHQVALVSGRPKDSASITSIRFHFASPPWKTFQEIWRKVKDEPGVTDMRPMDHGNAWSLYFRDPEGNRLEVFCDTDWYIEQPCIEDLDLSQPVGQIRAKSDAFCRNAPGFRPIAEYQAELAKKMGLRVLNTVRRPNDRRPHVVTLTPLPASAPEFDVCIIGYGPVGSALANLLGMSGLRVVVLEREPSVYHLPRAVALDGEGMRLVQTSAWRAIAATALRSVEHSPCQRRRQAAVADQPRRHRPRGLEQRLPFLSAGIRNGIAQGRRALCLG